ncbi:MAG: DUF1934 family protein [Clostridia bacterium]|nr:DUF1934 family protein [Clostridia bacterium]
MQACDLTIVTIADGTEKSIRRNAEMELTPFSAVLRYREENAVVTVRIENGKVFLSRDGDYSLFLPLKEGEETTGTLGIGGSEGEIKIFSERVGFSIGQRSLLAVLKYTLDFGREKQKMQIRLNAREKISEEK